MKLKHFFIILAAGIVLLAGVALFATFHSHQTLFYVTEGFIVLLLIYLSYFYRKTIRPYDTLIGGMELVRELDLTTRLARSGQYETDIIVRTFNDLLSRLRSEHLRLEEQYTFLNLLIEASPMGVIQCDLDGNTTTMNPAAREMMSPAIEESIQSLPLGETTTVRIPGEPQLFRISHLSFPDRGFQHPFFLIESLTSEIRLAEKAAYERVIRMIAHEVNNSVAGIIGSLAGDEAERLTALSSFVSRFAEVVKIPQPQLQLCDLSEEVEACRPFLENLCTQAHVRLDFHLTDEAVPVHLDTVLFQQVLINIVKNAVEAASPPTSLQGERGVITIATYYQPANHSTPLPYREGHGGGSLVITDNGHGIPPAIAKNLFTPFFSTKPQGQGLGLLLIRDILTAHHCTFNLHTDPEDHLTRFTIQFPKK
ncbi:MAG: PAS domain-containing sensor histidine kinase [Bacteroidaceae bacterium]|nr:PAS domain-containing sensor histidine kinase [Bacteroidaceae bacterium]MBR3093839.1 PAS domain-containing sensor histidine kinase [Bacteroidaceae bacterium]